MKIKVGDIVKVKNSSRIKNNLFEVISITADSKSAAIKNTKSKLSYLFPTMWLEVCKNARNS